MNLSPSQKQKWVAYFEQCDETPLADIVILNFIHKLHRKVSPLSQVLTIAREHGLDPEATVSTYIQDECLLIQIPLPLPDEK